MRGNRNEIKKTANFSHTHLLLMVANKNEPSKTKAVKTTVELAINQTYKWYVVSFCMSDDQ